jgi:hypothetical protein
VEKKASSVKSRRTQASPISNAQADIGYKAKPWKAAETLRGAGSQIRRKAAPL